MARGGMVRIGEAAMLAGVSRSTMHRALKTGRISDERGERLIDPAEVARVFPDTARTVPWHGPWNAEARQLEPPETATALEVRLAVAEALLGEREREIAQLRELVADLRRRLDAAEAERRQITLALTDQRPQAERETWWRRWWRES